MAVRIIQKWKGVSYEIEDFGETDLCKLRGIRRSRVLRVILVYTFSVLPLYRSRWRSFFVYWCRSVPQLILSFNIICIAHSMERQKHVDVIVENPSLVDFVRYRCESCWGMTRRSTPLAIASFIADQRIWRAVDPPQNMKTRRTMRNTKSWSLTRFFPVLGLKCFHVFFEGKIKCAPPKKNWK